jgi:spore coat polysaccharide biosynthesis protein SpsF
MKNTGIISQARMTSTRLPGKILIPAGEKTVLEQHVHRLRWSGIPVFIATTVNATDDPVAEFCTKNSIPVHRGSEDHVLSRYYECALRYGLDVIVRVTSDCPLVDGNLIRKAVESYLEWNDPRVYLSNCIERTYPRGFDFEIFSFAALEEAWQKAESPSQFEHVTPYIQKNVPGSFVIRHVKNETDASRYRITLDTPDDLLLIRKLLEEHHCAELSAAEIIAVMDANPHLFEINRHIEQKKV